MKSSVSKSDIFLNKMITDFLNQNFAGIQIISEENDQRCFRIYCSSRSFRWNENFVSGLQLGNFNCIWKIKTFSLVILSRVK